MRVQALAGIPTIAIVLWVSALACCADGQTYTLSGYVYEGAPGGQSTPLAEVIVELYCSNDSDAPGVLADSTTTIPERMQETLETGLRELVGEDRIRHVRVELSSAGTSSLDYEIEVDVDGDAAPRREVIRRAISQLLVDACHENHWEIPFPQLTVHTT